jgi:hypothetical protein
MSGTEYRPEGGARYWEKNFAVLQSRYPALAEQMLKEAGKAGGLPDTANDTICVETAVSGAPALIINGTHIHSNRDPVREGRRQAEAALAGAEKDGAVIVLGFGLGYAALAAAEMAAGRPLIIVERRPALFRLALEDCDMEAFLSPGTPVFVLGGEPDGVTGALGLLEQAGIRVKPAVLKNRALAALSPEDEAWYAEAERRIRSWAAKDEVNAATLRRFGKRWTGNLAANIGAVRSLPGVGRLAGCLRGADIPVFLAAAGPALDECGPFIKQIHERCLIIAVDTSLRFLLAAGICPDFTVSADPQYWNARHLDRLEVSCLVAESAVYPQVLREGSFKRAFLYRSMFPLGRFVEDRTDPKGELGRGGSVATTAWDFARLLSPSAIWIAGLDLAFPGLKTHFRGALFEENVHAESRRFVTAETRSHLALENGLPFPAASVSGGRVLTDKRLSLYAAWFENHAGLERNIPSYNLSSSGLAIKGLIPAKLETLSALPDRRREINALLAAAFVRIDAAFNAEKAAREQRYGEALHALTSGLDALREQAGQAGKLAGNVLRDTSANREKALARLEALHKALAVNPVKDAAGFLSPPAAELEARLTETDKWRRHLEFSALLYAELAASADFILAALEKTLTYRGNVLH